MWRSSFLLLVLCQVATRLSAGNDEGEFGDAAVPVAMKKYTVDLDQPPEKRWLSILPDYRSSVPLILRYFNQSVSIFLASCSYVCPSIISRHGRYQVSQ